MNAPHPGFEAADRRRREARIWHLERRSNPELPCAVAIAWQKWIANPENRSEYEEVARARSVLRSFPAPPPPSRAELLADVDEDQAHTTRLPEVLEDLLESPDLSEGFPVGRRVLFALGCPTLVIIVFVWIGPHLLGWPDMTFARYQVYRTAPGVLLEVSLPDHSTATLGGATTLRVLFSKHWRRVVLDQGEAFFDVQHDARIPFEVVAGDGRIVDRGTAFVVRRYASDVEVSVTRGIVDVSADAPPNVNALGSAVVSSSPVEVRAGQQVGYDENGNVGHLHPTALQEVAGWLYGTRVYKEKPLVKVIADLQLYLTRRIELDPRLEHFLFSGQFSRLNSARVEQWLQTLPMIYPEVDVDGSNPHLWRVRCRVEDCTHLTP